MTTEIHQTECQREDLGGQHQIYMHSPEDEHGLWYECVRWPRGGQSQVDIISGMLAGMRRQFGDDAVVVAADDCPICRRSCTPPYITKD